MGDNINVSDENSETTTDRRTLLRAAGASAAALGATGLATGSAAAADPPGGGCDHGGHGMGGPHGGPAWFEGSEDAELPELLGSNGKWTELLPPDYFEGVRTSQDPGLVTICCSDSRVSQEGMFLAPLAAGSLFKPSNIGNQAAARVDGEVEVDGSFLYGLESLDTGTGAVVGHTGCGAVTAAYEVATGGTVDQPDAVVREVEPLVGIVEEALDAGAVDTDADEGAVVNRLVEYNVNAQIELLRGSDAVDDDRDLYGFVYDFQGAYGDVAGRTVLVNADGETDPEALREAVPSEYEAFVGSLLA